MSNPTDSLDWSPGEALRAAAEKADQEDADASIAIVLNRSNGAYITGFTCAGLKTSEMIALLEIMKLRLMTDFLIPRE